MTTELTLSALSARPSAAVLLIGTYDLGHQPFGLASPAAWLREAGHQVRTIDLSREELDAAAVHGADLIAFYVPMHTATRLALSVMEQVRRMNDHARICFYGLYGQANVEHLLALGADAVISGEFEAELLQVVQTLAATRPTSASQKDPSGGPVPVPMPVTITSTERLDFRVPDRTSLPALDSYAQLAIGSERRVVGYTEASRGCRHLCRHCPVAPVYNGRVRVVQRDVVLSDICAQVEAGAEHITFGDPDFFNASAHGIRVVEDMHERFPDLTYDVTIKVEHLLKHRGLLRTLAATGCLFVTSAVESVDDAVLEIFAKGHTRAEFVEAVHACRQAGVALNPTFVTFHPWLTRGQLLDTFTVLDELDLVESLAPIQLTTRLLVPEGSLLLGTPEISAMLGAFDGQRLVYPWNHPDPELDQLQLDFESLVADAGREEWTRHRTFDRLWTLAGGVAPPRKSLVELPTPRFLEPWFCCSEPVGELLTGW